MLLRVVISLALFVSGAYAQWDWTMPFHSNPCNATFPNHVSFGPITCVVNGTCQRWNGLYDEYKYLNFSPSGGWTCESGIAVTGVVWATPTTTTGGQAGWNGGVNIYRISPAFSAFTNAYVKCSGESYDPGYLYVTNC